MGAFSFGPEAEIYKNIAMEVVPVIARGIQQSGERVTLDALYRVLGQGGLLRLARDLPDGPTRDRLLQLDEDAGRIGAAGNVGLQRRLGALMEGKFGPLFAQQPALDWAAVTQSPSVTYIALSATAAGEDVELFGRVITQDLKQLCSRRLRAEAPLTPVVVMYDEFAALREAQQIVDLLLQARQAKMPVVVATQYLPEEIPIRIPVLQSGVVIAHRLAHDDAEQVANELGTRKVPFSTSQIDYDTGLSEKGSVRMVDEFNIHPNILRTLPLGSAAVYVRRSERRAVVRIQKDAL